MVGDTLLPIRGVRRTDVAFKEAVFSLKHVWLRCLWELQVEEETWGS